MSETNTVTVEFASTTAGVEAGSEAASAAVQQATAEIAAAVTEMAEKAEAAGEATTSAIQSTSEKSASLLSGLSERVKLTGESFENLHASLSVFGAAAGAFGEFVLAGLGIEKVADMVNEVAESGEQLLHLSQATGISVEQLSGLKLATAEAGQNFDTFQQSILRFGNNMETAVRSPTSTAAAAFNALFGSAQSATAALTDSEGHLKPLAEVLDEVNTKLSGYADGSDKAAIEMATFGMRGQELVPILAQLQGDGGLEGAAAKAQQYGVALSDAAAESDERFEVAVHDAQQGVAGFSTQITQSLIPALSAMISGEGETAQQSEIMGTVLGSVDTVLKGLVGTAAIVVDSIKAIAAVCVETVQELGVLVKSLAAAGAAMEGQFKAAELDAVEAAAMQKAAVGEATEKVVGDYENVIDVLKALRNESNDYKAPDLSVDALPPAPALAVPGNDTAAKAAAKNEVQIAQDAAEEQTQIAQLRYQQQVDIWDAEVAKGKITKAQELQDEINAANQQYAADMDAAEAKTKLYADGTAAKAKALDDETVLELKHNDDILKLDAQLAQEQAAQAKQAAAAQKAYADGITTDFENAFKPIDSAFSSTINGIIQGTQTLQGGIDRMLGSIVLSVIDDTEKMLMHWAAMELGKLVASANSQAGIEAINAQGKAVQAASDIAQIENAAAVAAAHAYAAVAGIPFVGPFLAPAAAAAAFVGVMAFDVISAAGGAENIASDGTLGILHAQEMVLPASIAAPLRANIASGGSGFSPGGGGDVHMHFSPNLSVGAGASKADTTAALNESAAAMYDWAQQNYGRNGALTLPGRTPA